MKETKIDEFLTTDELSVRWKVHVKTLNAWRENETISIPFYRIGRGIRYKLKDIEAYEKRSLEA